MIIYLFIQIKNSMENSSSSSSSTIGANSSEDFDKLIENVSNFYWNSSEIELLNLSDKNIEGTFNLNYLPKLLSILFINNNKITEIVGKHDNLKFLNCSTNNLNSIDLNMFPNLITLDCSSNSIISINASNLPNIKNSNSNITKKKNSIGNLNCSNNPIKIMNLDDYPELSFINVSNCGMIKMEFYSEGNIPANIDNQQILGFNENNNFIKLKNVLNCNLIEGQENLKYVSYSNNLNKYNTSNLPINLECLIFGYSYNLPVENLPSQLKYLTFGDCFNMSVDNLPSQLAYLKFGYRFNQSVEKLPNTIKYLFIGRDFNRVVEKLPDDLVYIQVYSKFVDSNNNNFNKLIENLKCSIDIL